MSISPPVHSHDMMTDFFFFVVGVGGGGGWLLGKHGSLVIDSSVQSWHPFSTIVNYQ